ncbi:MAG: hypothetical protein K0R68_619 [Mycobacterium sp.]|nr:hypothetical protein [Mycobacterium sp.]
MSPGRRDTHVGSTNVEPTRFTRIHQALQPDWVHSVRTRRVVAAALVLLAGAAALRSEPGGHHSTVVVADRDLSPGVALTADDLRLENRPASGLPDGAQTNVDAVLDTMPVGPVRRGEVLTDVRVVGARLTEAVAGPDGRVVPLHLAQEAIVEVIHAGDIVDIVAAPQSDPDATARVVATDAVVVLISPESGGLGGVGDRVVLVALPAAAATAVAAATLVHTITLTLH